MHRFDGVAARQVGDGAGHFQAAVGAAAAPAQLGGGFLQQGGGPVAQAGVRVNGLALQSGVGTALPNQSTLASGQRAGRNRCGAFARWRVQQVLRGQAGHFDVQVDPVQQRSAELALVTADLVG